MNFYANKSPNLPRKAYRRAMTALESSPALVEIRPPVETLCRELETLKGDYLKLRFHLPRFLEEKLTVKELDLVNSSLSKIRGKIRDRLKFVYPACTDEFSLSMPFLTEVFGLAPVGGIDKGKKCFAVGSCFARNIGQYLSNRGFDINVLPQSEDLNSPFSNAALLELCAADSAYREQFITEWFNYLFPEESEARDQSIRGAIESLATIKEGIASYDVVILTLGNNLDFFGETPAFESGFVPQENHAYSVAPKFLGFVSSPDLEERMNFAKIASARGFGLRPGTFSETQDAVLSMLRAIRKINSSCDIYLTVSPVPIESAVGLSDDSIRSVVELDCQSKSQLRTIVDEIKVNDVTPFTYFPSYEIVRWISPMVYAPTFGAEDASSQHVSSDILQSIFDLFVECYCEE